MSYNIPLTNNETDLVRIKISNSRKLMLEA